MATAIIREIFGESRCVCVARWFLRRLEPMESGGEFAGVRVDYSSSGVHNVYGRCM